MARWDPENEDRSAEIENMDFKGLSGHKQYPIDLDEVVKNAINENP